MGIAIYLQPLHYPFSVELVVQASLQEIHDTISNGPLTFSSSISLGDPPFLDVWVPESRTLVRIQRPANPCPPFAPSSPYRDVSSLPFPLPPLGESGRSETRRSVPERGAGVSEGSRGPTCRKKFRHVEERHRHAVARTLRRRDGRGTEGDVPRENPSKGTKEPQVFREEDERRRIARTVCPGGRRMERPAPGRSKLHRLRRKRLHGAYLVASNRAKEQHEALKHETGG
eukprot:scaffold1401_cov330-Pavlova_lutheri.AAC.158